MKKSFLAGTITTIALVVAGVVIWLSLHEQTKGIIIGVILGVIALFLGAVFAFAVVGVMLLAKLKWGVNISPPQQPPIIVHGMPWPQPQLPPPADGFGTPPARAPREWNVLGADDIEDER